MRFTDEPDLPEALDRLFTEADARASASATASIPPLDAMGLGDLMALVRAQYGTVTASARAVGVDRRTWQRWETGAIRNPRAGLAKLRAHAAPIREQAVRDARRSAHASQRAAFGAAGGLFTITAWVAYSNDERERRINLTSHLTAQSRQRIANAYYVHGADAAAEAFKDAMASDWVEHGGPADVIDITRISELRWGGL